MNEWKEYKLSELIEKVIDNRGKSCPTSETGFPLIATNCIRNEKLYPDFINVRYISNDTYKNWFRGHPEPGDLILVLKGTPGRVCFTPDPVNFCIAQDMVALRVKNEIIYPKYLFALLRSSLIQQRINSLHVGSLIPHFKKGDFDKLKIPVFHDYKLQVEIGNMYYDFCEKIELNNAINKNLEDIAQALFKHWFVDFNFPNEHGEPYKSSGGEMIESKFGKIPKNWKIITLETIANVLDPHPSHRAPKEVENGYPFAGIGDIDEYGNIDTNNARKVSEASIIEQELSFKLNNKTIGYGRVGTVGKVVRLRALQFRYAISPTLAVIDPIHDGLSLFTLILLKSDLFYQRMMEFESGTTRPTIGIQALRKIGFPFPDNVNDNILKEYSSALNGVEEQIDTLNLETQILIKLRDILLPKLISGKLEVNEALSQTIKAV